jgi:hypothetical protein
MSGNVCTERIEPQGVIDQSNGFVRTLPDPIFANYGSEGCVFESRRVQVIVNESLIMI